MYRPQHLPGTVPLVLSLSKVNGKGGERALGPVAPSLPVSVTSYYADPAGEEGVMIPTVQAHVSVGGM